MTLTKSAILLIDDDVQNLLLLEEALSSRYEIRTASDPHLGVSMALANPPQLIVCDIDMPGMSGIEVCEAIRAGLPKADAANLPIVFLTSDPHASTMQRALAVGGNDYLIKPFRLTELMSRLELRLGQVHADSPLRSGNLRLDPAMLSASIEFHGKVQHPRITQLGYKILRTLIANEGRLLSREQLLDEVWGSLDVSDRAIDLHVFRLRKLLRHWDRIIESIYGRGYRVVEKTSGRRKSKPLITQPGRNRV